MAKTLAMAAYSLSAVAALMGCAERGPTIQDGYTSFTPIYRDNRVYYVNRRSPGATTQLLTPQDLPSTDATDVVPRNSPLSIIVRSIEIPAAKEIDASGKTVDSLVTGAADYAVILDIGTKDDGTSESIVVWYQRGVEPDQSLNFSNLLVYYQPIWDERIAPTFHIRVMDVTTEKNAETRKALERAGNIGGALSSMAANPAVKPLIGIAFTAAELVAANKSNKLLLDYTVQLYSSSAATAAGSGELGVLRRGSYIVIGRPHQEGREFWRNTFNYEPSTHAVYTTRKRVNVPTAAITVGTFASIVPQSVMKKSAELTTLLATNGVNSSIEQIDDTSNRLATSITAFTLGERLTKYRSQYDAENILIQINDQNFTDKLGSDDRFLLLRSISSCYNVSQFKSFQEATDYVSKLKDKKCVEEK